MTFDIAGAPLASGFSYFSIQHTDFQLNSSNVGNQVDLNSKSKPICFWGENASSAQRAIYLATSFILRLLFSNLEQCNSEK